MTQTQDIPFIETFWSNVIYTVSTMLPCILIMLIILIRDCNSDKSHCLTYELFSTPSSPINCSHPKPLLTKAPTLHKMKGIQRHLWLCTEHCQCVLKEVTTLVFCILFRWVYKFYFSMQNALQRITDLKNSL